MYKTSSVQYIFIMLTKSVATTIDTNKAERVKCSRCGELVHPNDIINTVCISCYSKEK
jgi:formylmethanofuran dehydrogenase subunit E